MADQFRDATLGFVSPGLIDALNYTEGVHENPGTYHAPNSDCVSHTIETGAAAGVSLPGDVTPEYFGHDLPPSD